MTDGSWWLLDHTNKLNVVVAVSLASFCHFTVIMTRVHCSNMISILQRAIITKTAIQLDFGTGACWP